MSKDDISLKYLDFLTNAIGDLKTPLEDLSHTYKEFLKSQKGIQDLIKSFNKGAISSKELARELMKEVRATRNIDLGIQDTSKSRQIDSAFEKRLAKVLEGKNISDKTFEKLMTAISNLGSTGIEQSVRAEKEGRKDGLFKNVSNNKVAKEIANEVGKAIDRSNDSLTYKLTSFFGTKFSEAKKGLVAFGADLIEGLAKNKFIGGALGDTVKLFGLMGAHWLSKHFGALGEKIGAGLIAISQVLATILPTLLLAGIGNMLFGGRLTKLLGTVFKGGFGLLKNLLGKGSLKNLFSGNLFKRAPKQMTLDLGLGGASKFAKMSQFAKAGAKKIPIAGAAIGALFDIPDLLKAGKEGKASLAKQGLKTAGGAAGTAAGSLIGGAIGALFGGVGAPIGVLIGGIVGDKVGHAVGGLLGKLIDPIKEHKEALKTILENVLIFVPIFRSIKKIVEGIWNLIPGKKDNNGSSGDSVGEVNIQPVKNGIADTKVGRWAGVQDTAAVRKIGNLGINKYGQMTNIGSMTQNQASAAIQEYMKQDRESFDRNYEILDSKYAKFSLYKNDAVIKDSKGNITGVLAAKGTKDRIDGYRNALRAKGVPESVVNQILATGGLSTKSSPHKAGGAYSHSNLGAYSLDLALPKGQYGKTVYDTIRDMSYAEGFDSKWEGVDKNGNFYFKNQYKEGLENAHIDMKLRRGWNNPSEGAMQNYEESKLGVKTVQSQGNPVPEKAPMTEDEAQVIKAEAAGLLWRQDRETYNKVDRASINMSYEEGAQAMQEELKKSGISYDPNSVGADGKQGRWIKQTSEGPAEIVDPSGNRDFADGMLQLVRIANYGG